MALGRSAQRAAATARLPNANDTRKQPAHGVRYTIVRFLSLRSRDQPFLGELDFHS